jgi:acetyl-CoA carboxylase biotin carboxylase subunit
MKPLKKLLIANRGEIAVRIVRACRELNIRAVAVYSEADANAMHVREADEAVLIGPPAPRGSYLRGEKLIEAAQAAGAQAIHPGYGFLAENADFAEAVRAAGLIFVGPTPEAMRAMGNKTGARALMQSADVPIVPGYHGAADAGFSEMAGTIGYPVLVKAAAGGGGRGMRVVHGAAELEAAVESAEREAASAFGDGSIFLEKYVANARHIEFQVFGDAHGNVVHLFERECSIQRRHQKIIEESPSPLLAAHPELRARMAEAAVAAARAVHYQNAGTIEFIVDPDTLQFYFLEMNTRLQVEHPVTEAVTGLDLVHLQLRVAAGEQLPFKQAQVTARGHAIECRVTAEDPANGFLPSSGPVLAAREPHGPGVRVDAGYQSGDEISPHYDSLVAKVIACAPTRADALARMDNALARYIVLGLTTNISFLRAVLAHPEFRNGAATTRFIETRFANWQPRVEVNDETLIAAALAEALGPQTTRNGPAQSETVEANNPWNTADGFRIGKGG